MGDKEIEILSLRRWLDSLLFIPNLKVNTTPSLNHLRYGLLTQFTNRVLDGAEPSFPAMKASLSKLSPSCQSEQLIANKQTCILVILRWQI